MLNREISQRLQHLIDVENHINQRLAVKTKKLHKSLHSFSNKTDEYKENIATLSEEAEALDETLKECQDLIEEVDTAQIRYRQQINRYIKKKGAEVVDSKNGAPTEHDRQIYSKKLLKTKLLQKIMKTRIMEKKSLNEITVRGYTVTDDELYPFETTVTEESDEITRQILWNQINLNSPFVQEWSDLFELEPTTIGSVR